jgi:hypothetical protein
MVEANIKTKYELNSLKRYEILDYVPILETNELDFVYRPNDDSFLFLDALKLDLDEIKRMNPAIVLEIG